MYSKTLLYSYWILIQLQYTTCVLYGAFSLISWKNFTYLFKKNMYSNTFPQVEAKLLLMPCWLKIVLNALLKTPLVKTFTSRFIVFKWSTIDAIVQLFLDRLSNLIFLILSYCTGLWAIFLEYKTPIISISSSPKEAHKYHLYK